MKVNKYPEVIIEEGRYVWVLVGQHLYYNSDTRSHRTYDELTFWTYDAFASRLEALLTTGLSCQSYF